jgi:DNA-binding response OmpR family regulator
MKNNRILIVEDDPVVLTLTSDLLLKEGFLVEAVTRIKDCQDKLAKSTYDLLVMDLNLPDGDGLKLCEKLKQTASLRSLPIFMLTARGSADDIVKGLEAGADDYLPKPFNEREFIARVRVILRDKQPYNVAQDDLVSGKLRLSLKSHEAWLDGKALALTLREFDILHVLMAYPDQALSREDILKLAWGPGTAIVPKVVDVHIGHLRAKLDKEGARIETVPQMGFRLINPKK